MTNTNSQLEARVWGAADELRANSKLRASDYSCLLYTSDAADDRT